MTDQNRTTASTTPPALGELLGALARLGLPVVVELTAGPFELGRVFVGASGPVHADAPGASGDRALELLAGVSVCRAHLRPVPLLPEPTLTPAAAPLWQDLRPTPSVRLALEAGWQARTLALVSTTTPATLSLLPTPAPTPSPTSTTTPPTTEDGFDAFFRRGTTAYLHHDFVTAARAFEACLALRPGDRRTVHNLERLKNRLPELS